MFPRNLGLMLALEALVGCQSSLDLDQYSFGVAGGGGSGGIGGSSGEPQGGSSGNGPDMGGAGGSDDGGPDAGGSGGGGGTEPSVAVLPFAHYSFTRGAAPYVVTTEVGLLRPGSGISEVSAGTLQTRREGSVELAADGSFSYTPAGSTLWGDDYFSFSSSSSSEAGTVRISLQPGVVSGLSAQEPELGNGFAIAGPPRVSGDSAERYTGEELASAGDVNGDGFDDLVVTGSGLQRTFVVFGKADAAQLVLPTLMEQMPASAGFVIDTSGVGGRAIVSGAGDVNGDGFDDIVLGTPSSAVYAAFVVFGSAEPSSLVLPDATPGRSAVISIIRTDVPGTTAADVGRSVAAAGDVNGDGFDDFVLGGDNLDTPGAPGGASYVIFGAAQLESVPLYRGFEEFQGADSGFAIRGGDVVRGAGDVNGDGLSDLIIGAPGLGSMGSDRTAAYVVFGKKEAGALLIANVAAGQGGFGITGAVDFDGTGQYVSGAGDVNGDGLDDLIVGAPLTGGGVLDEGAAYVVFGKPDTAAVSLDTLGALGFAITSSYPNAGVGNSVSGAGDFNGDGLADVLIGSREATVSGETGAAFIVFGKRNTTAVSLASLESGQLEGLALLGTASARTYVSEGGDVNRDGLSDVLVAGAWSDAFVGRIYALFGWDASDQLQARRAVLAGQRGDDTLDFDGTPLVSVSGGHGSDTLRFVGSGLSLDLRGSAPRVTGIEHIDLRGSGDNTLVLDDAAVRRVPENGVGLSATLSRSLVLTGNVGDRVILDLTGYTPGPSNAGREVWLRDAAVYGLEATPGLIVAPP